MLTFSIINVRRYHLTGTYEPAHTEHVLSPNFGRVYKLSGRVSLNCNGNGDGDVADGIAATYQMNGIKNNIDSIASKE